MSSDNEEEKYDGDVSRLYAFGGASSTKKDEEGTGVPLWLITFADVMALMLTFFVLLYSMAVPREEEWSHMTTALNTEFNKFYNAKWREGQQDTISIEKLDFSSALDIDYLTSLVRQLVAQEELLGEVILIPQKGRLVVSMPNDLLFDSGKADVKLKGKSALFALGGTLQHIKNRIEIIGHTDPRPIRESGGEFPSNWELSLARAANIAAVLEDVGYRKPVTVRGLSHARYDELPSYLSEEERLSFARRVDIIIMEDDGSRRVMLNLEPI